MHDTDLVVLADVAGPLRFSPAGYYAQLEAGRTEALPNFALAAYVKPISSAIATTATPNPR